MRTMCTSAELTQRPTARCGMWNEGVKLHQHLGWQLEFPQLPQEEHPLLCLLDEEADGELPLEVMGMMVLPRKRKESTIEMGIEETVRSRGDCCRSEV